MAGRATLTIEASTTTINWTKETSARIALFCQPTAVGFWVGGAVSSMAKSFSFIAMAHHDRAAPCFLLWRIAAGAAEGWIADLVALAHADE